MFTRHSHIQAQSYDDLAIPGFEIRPSRYSMVGGKRSVMASLSSNFVFGAYTYNSKSNSWSQDSLLLALSKDCLRSLIQARSRISPVSQSLLDNIVRTVLLGDCSGPPLELMRLLKNCPSAPPTLEGYSISSPIPLYHASGKSKDVFLFMLLLYPHTANGLCRELVLALKLDRKSGSIDKCELDYHQALDQTQKRRSLKPVISHLLGWCSLDDYPSLKMSGRAEAAELHEKNMKLAHSIPELENLCAGAR